MLKKIQDRLAREESGFTLIELLVVIIILGILLAIAIPSYLSFKDRANKTAAAADVRSAVPDVASYAADNSPNSTNDPDSDTTDSGYSGMTWTELQSKYDPAISSNVWIYGDGDTTNHPVPSSMTAAYFLADPAVSTSTQLTAPDATHYCVYGLVGTWFAWKDGDTGNIQEGTDGSKVCQS